MTARTAAPPDEPTLDAMFVSAKDAAHYLGVSRNHVYDLCRERVIESRIFRQRRLILLSSLRAFAEALPSERD